MPRLIAVLFMIVWQQNVTGQQTGKMETDRPDQTESPAIVKTGYIQIESGLTWQMDDNDMRMYHPTVLWKYGIIPRLEARLITESVTDHLKGDESSSGLLPAKAGFKFLISHEHGVLPDVSIIAHMAIPFAATKHYQAAKWAPEFRFTMQHSIGEDVAIGYNAGAEWDGESSIPKWVYTLAPGLDFADHFYCYAEISGSIQKDALPEHIADIGFAYYLNDNTKFDISSGYGLSHAAMEWYVAIGFSCRFH